MTDVPRIILGQRGSEVGFWVTKPGYDASNASLAAQSYLVNSSAGPCTRSALVTHVSSLPFYSYVSGTANFRLDISHTLGYAPLVITDRPLVWSNTILLVTSSYIRITTSYTAGAAPTAPYPVSDPYYVTMYHQRAGI